MDFEDIIEGMIKVMLLVWVTTITSCMLVGLYCLIKLLISFV